MHTHPRPVLTFLYTTLAMVAFAANSVICRLALGAGQIDAASFTSIRLISGVVALVLIVMAQGQRTRGNGTGNWASAAMLFLYAAAFSFAYISLDAGTGALILFGAVQITMIVAALHSGERPRALEWQGLVLALIGLVVLVSPGLTAPAPAGAALMSAAGVGWGVYSLRGRRERRPLGATAGNFMRAAPLALAASLLLIRELEISPAGALWAVCSGALASGLGYVIWYAALRGLTATRAATVQLTVPVLAALGGVLFLAESVSLRLLVSGILVLGGVALAVLSRRRKPSS